MKIKIEIRDHSDQDLGKYKAIFADGNLFDWGMPKSDLKQAAKFAGSDPFLKKSIHGDIQRNFLESFSEFLGKEIYIAEVNEAIEKGYIEC